MSDYPEHDKLSAISDQSQVCGEFADWLGTQGIHLMMWREDLTDVRPADPECKARADGARHNAGCKPPRPVKGAAMASELYAPGGVFYSMQHCTHWLGGGDCCLCGAGQTYEVHGLSSWIHPGKSLTALLAEFFGIDQSRIEAEKRAMLARCAEMAG